MADTFTITPEAEANARVARRMVPPETWAEIEAELHRVAAAGYGNVKVVVKRGGESYRIYPTINKKVGEKQSRPRCGRPCPTYDGVRAAVGLLVIAGGGTVDVIIHDFALVKMAFMVDIAACPATEKIDGGTD